MGWVLRMGRINQVRLEGGEEAPPCRGKEARKCAAYPGSDKPSGLVGQSRGYPGQHWWEKEGKIPPSQIPSGPDARVGIWA